MTDLPRSEYFSSAFYDIIDESLKMLIKGAGKSHTYQKVPENIFKGLVDADDQDKYFKENIKGKYELLTPY